MIDDEASENENAFTAPDGIVAAEKVPSGKRKSVFIAIDSKIAQQIETSGDSSLGATTPLVSAQAHLLAGSVPPRKSRRECTRALPRPQTPLVA